MELWFKEIYCNDNYIKPLFEIPKDNGIFDDLNYNVELDDTYILDFNNLIDNYDTIELINNIFSSFKLNFIDKDIWKQFLINKYNNEIRKEQKTHIIKPIKPNICENIKYKQPNKYKTKIEYNNLKELWTMSESLNGCHKIYIYNDLIDNKDNYKYIALNIIFSSNINFKIKRCKNCKKPFITNNQNFETCHRIYKNNITCNKYEEKVRKQHQYDNPIKKLEKRVRNKLEKDNVDLYEKFKSELPNKRKEYYNDNKSFINWILNNYYFTENGRIKVIKELELSKYL